MCLTTLVCLSVQCKKKKNYPHTSYFLPIQDRDSILCRGLVTIWVPCLLQQRLFVGVLVKPVIVKKICEWGGTTPASSAVRSLWFGS